VQGASQNKYHVLIIEANKVLDFILPAWVIKKFLDAVIKGLVVELRPCRERNKALLVTEGMSKLNYLRTLAVHGELLKRC
jgi:hypothetical protein